MPHNITVNKIETSRISEVDFENIGFGKVFSDHMFVADWDGEKWIHPSILPYSNFSLSPATSAIHYGQSIFEGMKAFRGDNDVYLFRPIDNIRRLNISGERMVMPAFPEDLFMQALLQLIDLDRNWVPQPDKGTLYIRPFMFATDDFIGVKPSEKYRFAIFTCPVGPYYSKPLKVKVEEQYSRSAPGGVGFTKCAGNYGGAMFPTKIAQSQGFDQVLWTDPVSHTYVEETGTTNFFAVFNDHIATPALSDTLLSGITRDSCIQVLKSEGFRVEERKISVNELFDAHKTGNLKELFITGTAATLINIEVLAFRDSIIDLSQNNEDKLAEFIKNKLDAIRTAQTDSHHEWCVTVPKNG
jgi:branched-chain amino acid aminotransferase